MPEINQLSAVDSVTAGDQIPIFSTNNGDARKAAASVLRTYVLNDFIGSLNALSGAVADGDSFAMLDASTDTQVAVTTAELLTYLEANITSSAFTNYTTQYSAPSSSGFSVQVTNGSANIWLILTPTAGYAAGTIVLPAIANVVDKQEVLVNCTQQVNALTINGNGATAVTGEPLVLAADDFFRLRFDATTSSWYRVG